MSDIDPPGEPVHHPKRPFASGWPGVGAILAGALVLGVLFGVTLRLGTNLAQDLSAPGRAPAVASTPAARASVAAKAAGTPSPGDLRTSASTGPGNTHPAGANPTPSRAAGPPPVKPSKAPQPSTAPKSPPPPQPSPSASPSPSPTTPPTT